MAINAVKPYYHRTDPAWQSTPDGAPRGYIEAHTLSELWFHTGTACNLACPFCLEGSHPGDGRLEQIQFDEARPFLDEAMVLGVEQFSFTGGEPFVNRHILDILSYALELRPCLLLTNGTKPLSKRFEQILALRTKPNPIRFRVSFDYPDPKLHDANRGAGNFALALETVGRLYRAGFAVSIARLSEVNEDTQAVNNAYRAYFAEAGIPQDTPIVVFPDFFPPGNHPEGIPHITENCMTTYHTEESRAGFMCAYSRMVVKNEGRMRVYACTLVDDDPDYDLGGTLTEALRPRVMLRHHRCFSCFAHGASCSER